MMASTDNYDILIIDDEADAREEELVG